eukprot:2886243-Pyramimonas_sp.AAC.1
MQTFSWKTATGPTRIYPRLFEYISDVGLMAVAELFMLCERLLIWPQGRIINEIKLMGALD